MIFDFKKEFFSEIAYTYPIMGDYHGINTKAVCNWIVR